MVDRCLVQSALAFPICDWAYGVLSQKLPFDAGLGVSNSA